MTELDGPLGCVFLLRSGQQCGRATDEHDLLRLALCGRHTNYVMDMAAECDRRQQIEVRARLSLREMAARRLDLVRGSVMPHGNGWRYRITLPVDGRPRSVQQAGFRTKADAKRALTEAIASARAVAAKELATLRLRLQLDESIDAAARWHLAVVDAAMRRQLATVRATRDAEIKCERRVRESERVVYYVRRHDGRIKIGTTWDLRGRLSSFGTVQAVELLAAHQGGEIAERGLHRRFAHARVEGEWFEPVPALLEHIAHVAAVRPLQGADGLGMRPEFRRTLAGRISVPDTRT